MKKSLTLIAGTVATLALPLVTFAQAANNCPSDFTSVTDITSLYCWIVYVINNIAVPIIFALAFIVFLYGAFQTFIQGARDEGVAENGRKLMLYSLIGFFVMLSIWGLVNILSNSFNLNNTEPTTLPGANGSSAGE